MLPTFETIQSIVNAHDLEINQRLDRLDSLLTPPPWEYKVQRISRVPEQDLHILRDDVYFGGSKVRFYYDYFKDHPESIFVYPTVWYGLTQMALGVIKTMLERQGIHKRFIVIVKRYPLSPLGYKGAYMELAMKLGVEYVFVDDDPIEYAKIYAETNNWFLLVHGIPEAFKHIIQSVEDFKDQYGMFDECWISSFTGVTMKACKQVGLAKRYYSVNVDQKPKHIQGVVDIIPSEEFDEPSHMIPPYPSSVYYDSKVWSYVKDRRGKILVWNFV